MCGLMELTCWDSIKSAPIHLTPIAHSLQLIEAVQFHRHTFQYLLLPIDIEQVGSRVRRTEDEGHMTHREMMTPEMNEMDTTRRPRMQSKHMRNFSMRRNQRSGVWSANSKHIIDILWLENSWKNNQKGNGHPCIQGAASAPTHEWPHSPSRSPRLEKDGGDAPGVCRATSRLTVWLSFPIYPMRYLRLMCLKVNTMWHTLTQHRLRRGQRGQRES